MKHTISTNSPPEALEVNFEGIPQELKARSRWGCWEFKLNEGRWTKVPIDTRTGKFARPNDLSTWSTFGEAQEFYARHKVQGVNGIGFVFSKADHVVGIDLDKCRDPETGELNDFARDVVRKMNSYTELSPSGTGLHIIVAGELPRDGKNLGHIEMYDDKRYFTVTGHALPECPASVKDRDAELKALYYEVTSTKEKAEDPQTPSGNLTPQEEKLIAQGIVRYGQRFQLLWDGGQDADETKSQGDLALCTMLSVLIRRNIQKIDRLFRLSGRMRDKWDEVHYDDGRTYGQVTLETSVSGAVQANKKQEVKPAPRDASTAPPRETDVGNGKRLVAEYGNDLRYCHQMKTWLTWSGERWLLDDMQKIMQYAKETAAAIWQEVADADNESRRNELVKHARASESYAKLKAMAACAQSEPEVAITVDGLDPDHMLFNCKNGTLDLRNSQFWPHQRRDLITKIAPVTYDPDAACPRWKRFVDEIMSGDQEKVAFLQKAAGYSLTGSIVEQCLFFLFGLGRNGKSTFLEILKAKLGSDYACHAAQDTFTQRGIGHIPQDLARMRGSRLVTLPDFEKGMRLNEALLKQVTGGDQVTARHMYKGYFTYTPTSKLWLMGNHKPEIQDATHGMWRRIHVIEFGVQFKKDDSLLGQLLAELPGILNWVVQGCVAWQRDGLEPPRQVQEATASYREEMDLLSEFLQECCILKPGAVVPAATIYEAYTQWAAANQEAQMSKLDFGRALSERGFGTKHGRSGSLRLNIALKADAGGTDTSSDGGPSASAVDD